MHRSKAFAGIEAVNPRVYFFNDNGTSKVLAKWERMNLGGSYLQFMRGVAALIRCQLESWECWQSRLALIGIVMVAGPILSKFLWSLETAYGMTTVSAYFVYVEHLSGKDFTTMPELRDILFCLCFAAVVALWSWASGFVLATLFGRTIWLTGILFYLTVLNWSPFASRTMRLHGGGTPALRGFVLDRLLPLNRSELLAFFLPFTFGLWTGLFRKSFTVRQPILILSAISVLTGVIVAFSHFGYTIETHYGTIGAYGAPALNWQTAAASWSLIYMLLMERQKRDAMITPVRPC